MKPTKPVKLPQFDFLITALNSRTNREKQMIIIFVVALLFVLDYMLLLQPVLKTFSENSPKIAPLKQEIKELIEDTKSKDEIRQKWERAKKAIADQAQAFIAPDETPLLLENLSQQAQSAGVKIISLEPSDTTRSAGKGSYASLPITLKAMAGTHEFGTFLSNLETGRTLFRIKDLRIKANPIDERKHQIELTMESYKLSKQR